MPLTLLRRNPLAFPAGAKAGFDPRHPASARTVFSCVPAGGNFANLLNGSHGTIAAAAASPSIHGVLGPSTTLDNTGQIQFPVAAPNGGFDDSTTGQGVTLAAIFASNTNGFRAVVGASNNAGNAAIFIGTYNVGPVFWANVSGSTLGAYVTTIPFVAGEPYFLIASMTPNADISFLVKNLRTGVVQAQVVAGTGGVGSGFFNTFDYYGLGALGGQSSVNGPVAAGMLAQRSMSMSQLLAWAADPWAFWYPRQDKSYVTDTGGGGSSFLPAWIAPLFNLPVIGTGNY
jgi:hypothetical protein